MRRRHSSKKKKQGRVWKKKTRGEGCGGKTNGTREGTGDIERSVKEVRTTTGTEGKKLSLRRRVNPYILSRDGKVQMRR